jgi:hypothetical protein
MAGGGPGAPVRRPSAGKSTTAAQVRALNSAEQRLLSPFPSFSFLPPAAARDTSASVAARAFVTRGHGQAPQPAVDKGGSKNA